MTDDNYQLVHFKNYQDHYYFLIKHIQDKKYFMIPLDHSSSYLIKTYNRKIIDLNDQRNQDNQPLLNLLNAESLEYFVNDQPAMQTLIDFIQLGDKYAVIGKQSFLNDFINKVYYQK